MSDFFNDWDWKEIGRGILMLIFPFSIIAFCVLAAGTRYEKEELFQKYPYNCTAANLELRISQLDMISSIPVTMRVSRSGSGASSSVRSYPDDTIVDRNLRSMSRLSGCNERINTALDASGYALLDFNQIEYSRQRAVLIAELHTLQQQEPDQK